MEPFQSFSVIAARRDMKPKFALIVVLLMMVVSPQLGKKNGSGTIV